MSSVFLIVAIQPWNSTKLGESPFVAVLETIGIAGAADVMNAVVLTAVLSCLNSGLCRLADDVHARAPWRRPAVDGEAQLARRRAIPLATSVGYVSVIAAAIWPETVFLWLVNPWLTYLVIVAIVVVIGSMAFVDDVRSQLWWSLGSLAVVLGAYALRSRAMSGRRGRSGSAAAELPARPPSGRGRAPRPAARRP